MVRDVHPDGFRKLSRLVIILENLYDLGKVLLGLVIGILVRLEMAVDAHLQTGDIRNDMNGAATGYCDNPFHHISDQFWFLILTMTSTWFSG